jgi:hypothetical protein
VTWFKVDDKLHSHPKVQRTGLAAMGLWALAGSWSADYLTDGYIPPETLRGLGATRTHATRLTQAGLWVPLGDGWQFHGWIDYQPSRERVLERRADAAARIRRWREDHGPG